jgi:hypothetical protein
MTNGSQRFPTVPGTAPVNGSRFPLLGTGTGTVQGPELNNSEIGNRSGNCCFGGYRREPGAPLPSACRPEPAQTALALDRQAVVEAPAVVLPCWRPWIDRTQRFTRPARTVKYG